MNKKFGLGLMAFLFAAAPVCGQRPRLPGPDPFRSGGGMSGTIQLNDCNASPANVRITAGTRSVQPQPLPDNAFVWSYSLTGLTPGTYTVRPSMALSRCRGGSWSPVERRVTVENTLTPVPNINFEFRGRRDVTRINASSLASIIEGIFRGTVVHLNNYTPSRHTVSGRDSWHLANDSFLRRSAAMGGGETRFSLDEVSRGPLRYYVRDFNLSRVAVRPEADAFRLTFLFEDRGPVEIKGRCSNTTDSIDPACPVGSDDTAPDFEINTARLDVLLPPVRTADGDLTYGSVRVTFDADVQGGGVGDIFETQVKRSIRSNIEPRITSLVDDAALRRTVARSVRPALDRARVGSVITVRFEGGDLVIESYPR
jgi:hypothetical protein